MTTEQVTPRKFPTSWDNETAEEAGQVVATLVESPAWKYLLEAIQDFQRNEQKIQMMTPPADNPAEYERNIGLLLGLEILPSIAQGVVENGREASRKLRDAA